MKQMTSHFKPFVDKCSQNFETEQGTSEVSNSFPIVYSMFLSEDIGR